ncbi:tRNA lysidine(34) synthetase TilS [Sphingomonas sp. MG17]|uniref:tRNA(Ile)-lysidine synthase n=1 Tax=Sphingomonas tagetis TaxID=2949092 RepID=A0A9X2KPA8_9SPHN|nr:tRNA lysidine(34) synthetase TilS [Sphingomonas tagetis]MCP3730483.1 tRNA lysidine(34) synthetase TilS [Sphingomonas tagetis]
MILRATGAPLDGDARIALAVSGGADSMAMLMLAAATFPGRVIVATVDHGLRAEAADEAALVASLCTELGVAHVTLAPLEPIAGSSLQKQARAARYAALEAWMAAQDIDLLLTAHHADDQAETLLMRLNRASGTTGLSGIRPFRQSGDVLVLRPLLRWRRRELREVAQATGVNWVEDPSNADPRHDRTRYREFLAGQSLLSAGALAAAAAHIEETDAALAELTDRIGGERWAAAKGRLDASGLPREVKRRLVRRAILDTRTAHGVTAPHFSAASNVEALLDSLEAGRAATQAGVMVTPRGPIWQFSLAPARQSR